MRRLVTKYDAEKCELCRSKFSLLRLTRPHRCKRCLRFVCSDCGKFRGQILGEDGLSGHPQRLCYWCKEERESQDQLVSEHGLGWGKNSKLSEKWAGLDFQSQEQQFQQSLSVFHKNRYLYEAELDLIDKDVFSGRTDFAVFNFSLGELIHKLQAKAGVSREKAREDIAEVLYAVVGARPSTGYCQGMNMVAAVLLCFAQKARSFALFQLLLERIYPARLFNKNGKGTSIMGLLGELYFVACAYREVYSLRREQQISQKQFEQAKTYLELLGSRFFLTLGVCMLPLRLLVFLWDQIFTDLSFLPLERALLAAIWANRELMAQGKPFSEIQKDVGRCQFDAFKLTFGEIVLDARTKAQHLEEYNAMVALQWNSGSKPMLSKLVTLTKFTYAQLQRLHAIFLKYCEGFAARGFPLASFRKLVERWAQRAKLTWPNRDFAELLLASVNEDGDPLLDFRELTIATSMLCRTAPREMASLILRLRQGGLSGKQARTQVDLVLQMIRQSVQLGPDQQVELQLVVHRLEQKVLSKERISSDELLVLQYDPLITRLPSLKCVVPPEARSVQLLAQLMLTD